LHGLSQDVTLESDFHATSSVTSHAEVIRPRTPVMIRRMCPQLVEGHEKHASTGAVLSLSKAQRSCGGLSS